MRFSLIARITAEFVGTAFLLMAVVGSGIMGERLAGGNVAIALLANTIATGAALVALILTFGPISGAHFNPAVSLADARQRGMPWRETPRYVIAQILGAYIGVMSAHAMFALPLLSVSRQMRSGRPQAFRIHCYIRIVVSDLGVFATAHVCSAVCGWGVHHGVVLVHRIDIVRQPRRDFGKGGY